MTSSSAVPNIPKASQPLPASHCQVKHRHARGGRAPDVGGQREEGSQLRPTLTRQPLPGRRRSPRRCEIVFVRSARTRLADLFWGMKGCSERFPPLCVNVISHSTQNAPGTRNKKKNGCSDGPLNEQLLVPHHQAAWKNHVSCLFREPNQPGQVYAFPVNGRFAGRPPTHAWAVLCHCGHCPCCSKVPSYLNLSLPSQPRSEATSSWKPPESARSARSYRLSTSHLVFAGPCRPGCLTNAVRTPAWGDLCRGGLT